MQLRSPPNWVSFEKFRFWSGLLVDKTSLFLSSYKILLRLELDTLRKENRSLRKQINQVVASQNKLNEKTGIDSFERKRIEKEINDLSPDVNKLKKDSVKYQKLCKQMKRRYNSLRHKIEQAKVRKFLDWFEIVFCSKCFKRWHWLDVKSYSVWTQSTQKEINSNQILTHN